MERSNIALQQIMGDYAGPVRSETLLTAGLEYTQRLKVKACSSIIAKTRMNYHAVSNTGSNTL